ncbi:hypothetical protein FR943_06185 [Mycobacterium sp. TNTM28]|uniref:DUF4386 domain-containing protein n=1 Tax=[Mycobacterium] fortunisiensis TaxID=2600579 RepID=A0ABS6KIR8_9MYCO|nr:hypothetical protein [[Mycobacterium] fortunisiensis]MBU9763430.1 hypothetical protein [[Mycobacterium] fortunisiensis]
MLIALRSQKVLLWWTFIGGGIYGSVHFFLLRMFPPPSAQWTTDQIAQFYTDHSTQVLIGAVVMSWTAPFVLPLTIVLAMQMLRHEPARAPVWTSVGAAGGALMSIFMVLPPIIWGAAAFKPDRAAEVTAALHELGLLVFITTTQYFIFLWVALAVICLVPNTVVHSPFPRWFGYLTVWSALGTEAGAVAFLTRTGPFAWNGLLAFWLPTIVLGVWFTVVARLLLNAIDAQIDDEQRSLTTTAAATV